MTKIKDFPKIKQSIKKIKKEDFIKKSFTIRDLPKEERPRERLAKFGEYSLSIQELLQLILGRGIAGESVAVTAQKILTHYGSLQKLSEASIEELSQIKGIGPAKACQIRACFEIARRTYNNDPTLKDKQQTKTVLSAEDVYKLVKSRLKNYTKEHFFVLSFDSRNKFLGIDEISVGTLNANLVHPRETFEAAIHRHGAQVIIVHNHPSGDPNPSEDDLTITKQLIESGRILEIEIIDHIIVSRDGFVSLKAEGVIND